MVIQALAVSITEESDFARGGHDSVQFKTDIMVAALLLLEVEVVIDEAVVVVGGLPCLMLSHIIITIF